MSPLIHTLAIAPAMPAVHSAPATPAPELNRLMVFGAAAVFLMVLCRTHERYRRYTYLGTAAFALMSAVYGFMVGAWPLGLTLLGYSIASLRPLFASGRKTSERSREPVIDHSPIAGWQEESRMTRLFGHK